jgi:hypothetical protein
MNRIVARIRAAQAKMKADKTDGSEQAQQLKAIADKVITPAIRYSQPALQTHVTYLYGENNRTDQKVGKDALDRYVELRKEVDTVSSDLNRVLGPA